VCEAEQGAQVSGLESSVQGSVWLTVDKIDLRYGD
jgi:hypothetical protein